MPVANSKGPQPNPAHKGDMGRKNSGGGGADRHDLGKFIVCFGSNGRILRRENKYANLEKAGLRRDI